MVFVEFFMILIQALWFALPAYTANAAPIIAKKFLSNSLSTPIDFNKKFHGKPIFGSHKTFRGVISAVIFAIITTYIQKYLLYSNLYISSILIINYQQPLLIGFLFGFGTAIGDLTKSFVKRRLGIKPGAKWFPWDNMDYILGALLFISFIYTPPASIIVILLITSPIITIIANKIAFRIGWKEKEW